MSELSEFVAQKISQSDDIVIDYVTEAIARDINFDIKYMTDLNDEEKRDYLLATSHSLGTLETMADTHEKDPRFNFTVYDSNDDEILFLIEFEDHDYKVNGDHVGDLMMPKVLKDASGDLNNLILFNTSPEDVSERMKQGFKKIFETDQISLFDDGTMIVPRGLISTSGYMQVSLAFSFKYPKEDEYQTSLGI